MYPTYYAKQTLITNCGNGCQTMQTQKTQIKPGSLQFNLRWEQLLSEQFTMLNVYIKQIEEKKDLDWSLKSLTMYYISLNDFKYQIYNFLESKDYFKFTQTVLKEHIQTILDNNTNMVNTNFKNNAYFYPSNEEKELMKKINKDYIVNLFTIKDYDDLIILKEEERSELLKTIDDQLFVLNIPKFWCTDFYGDKGSLNKMKLAINLFKYEQQAEKILTEHSMLKQKNEYDHKNYKAPESELKKMFLNLNINKK